MNHSIPKLLDSRTGVASGDFYEPPPGCNEMMRSTLVDGKGVMAIDGG